MIDFSSISYVEVGYLKWYLIFVYTSDYRSNLNAVVAFAKNANQIKLDWAYKLGLGRG